jgi:hypothetical protein
VSKNTSRLAILDDRIIVGAIAGAVAMVRRLNLDPQ